MATFSPNTVGNVDTRKSTGRPATSLRDAALLRQPLLRDVEARP